MPPRIAGILFDLGETLLSFGTVDLPALFEEGSRLAYDRLQALGHRPPPFAQYHRNKLLAVRWNYLKSRLTGREFDVLKVLDYMHRGMGIQLPSEETLELAGLWYEPLGRLAVVEKGTLPALHALRERGLKLGLVSNTFIPAAILDRQLAQEGLLEYLPLRVYSCQVGWRKPNRRVFQAALDRGSLVPAETLFVGDSLPFDIRGANRMGMISVLMDPTGRKKSWWIKPRHAIRRIEEMPRVVEQYGRE